MVKEVVPTEHEEQRLLISLFRKKYDPVRIFAIPNGGYRGKIEAMKFKAEGVSAGVPDLYVPEWKLWIEMKRQKGGHVSAVQKDWHNYLVENCRDALIIGYGCDDALMKIECFLNAQKKPLEDRG